MSDDPAMSELPGECERDWSEVDDAGSENGEPPRRRRNGNSASTVFTVRLELSEYEALTRLAQRRGIGATVLARGFNRNGLQGRR